jgi:predicted dehydrogenase
VPSKTSSESAPNAGHTGRFRLAIVGCGKIAASHAEAALASGITEISALVDPAPERARALAERFDVSPLIARDVAEIIGAVDGAVIATPNATHAPLAEQFLRAGIAVLIEKPLAISPEDGQRICDAAAATGGTVAVGYVSRFRENVRLLGTLIKEGYFGRMHRFAYQFGTRGGWAPLSGYNLDRRASGGGVLVTTGTHFVDRMLDWFGYPDSAYLVDDAEDGPEANATVHVTFGGRNELTGIARFSKTAPLPAGFVMETDLGTVILKDRSDASVMLRPARRPGLVHSLSNATRPAGSGDEFVHQMEDFVTATRTRRPPFVTADQGQLSMRLIDELYRHRRSHVTAQEAVR